MPNASSTRRQRDAFREPVQAPDLSRFLARSCVLILAEVGDAGAVAVASATATRLPRHTVAVVRPIELSLATWTHTLGRDGTTTTTVTLPSGWRIADHELAAVLARSEATPVPRFTRSTPADRDYAAAEIRALLVSWLRSLGARAVNTAGGVSLTGPSWTPRRWLVEAHRAGLQVGPSVLASSAHLIAGSHLRAHEARLPVDTTASLASPGYETAVVAGDRVVGWVGGDVQRAACLRLAAQARCRLVELAFAVDAGSITVVAAGPGARLSAPHMADDPGVAAVADLLAHIAKR
jgi:hypothetical protein